MVNGRSTLESTPSNVYCLEVLLFAFAFKSILGKKFDDLDFVFDSAAFNLFFASITR